MPGSTHQGDETRRRRLRWRARRGLLENDLLDLLLGRCEPAGACAAEPVRAVLALMRARH